MAAENEQAEATTATTNLSLPQATTSTGKTMISRFGIPSGLLWAAARIHPVSNSTTSLESCEYNAASKCQRYWLTVRILAVSLFSVLGLLVVVSLHVHEAVASVKTFKTVKKVVDDSVKVADLIHSLQVERGLTVLSISSNQNASIIGTLASARNETLHAITHIASWLSDLPSNSESFHSEEEFIREIEQHRDVIDHGRNSTIKKEIDFYTHHIEMSLDWLSRGIKKNYPQNKIIDLLGYQMFLMAKDKIGIERALGGSFFARGYFNDTSDLLWYAEQNYIGHIFLQKSMELMKYLQDVYQDSISAEVIDALDSKRSIILENKPHKGNDSAGSQWFSLMTHYINVLLVVQRAAGENVKSALQKDVDTKETDLMIRLVFLVLVLILVPLMVFAVIRMTNTIQEYAFQLEATTLNLQEEQKRTDRVLFAMFPQSVAQTLKMGEKVNAEYFDSVTVFFSDIVNFTNICAMISPMEVTSMLNGIYSAFDDTIDKYDVYKVETIGDAYMVVSGLPKRNGVQHVDQICRMAIDLVQVTHDFELVDVPAEVLLIRVGVHTGPCVSGIVGVKMPRYCLFGDTVNTASRMQTTGFPQKIHITESTLKGLISFKGYETDFRGHVEVKGKGQMETYWLNSCVSQHQKTEASTEDSTDKLLVTNQQLY